MISSIDSELMADLNILLIMNFNFKFSHSMIYETLSSRDLLCNIFELIINPIQKELENYNE